MRVKRFEAATMPEALALVKATLGEEAVLLDTGSEGGLVTVTAAIDDDPPVLPEPPGGDDDLRTEVRELMGLVRDLVVPSPRALAQMGAAGRPLEAALADVLGRLPAPRVTRVRLFIGPPGDGKTTTVAKLAAQERAAGRRVVLVATDDRRLGGAGELSAYGRVLDVPVRRATGPEELQRILAALTDCERVLVDTAGAAPGQNDELAELAALAAAAGPEAACTLVASAIVTEAAALRVGHAFAPLRPDACILTKLDVAPAGGVLGLLWQRRLPVSHLATGRRIPDDLLSATPERLARCLLAA